MEIVVSRLIDAARTSARKSACFWQKQRNERNARLNAGSHYASGKIVPPESAKALLGGSSDPATGSASRATTSGGLGHVQWREFSMAECRSVARLSKLMTGAYGLHRTGPEEPYFSSACPR